MANHRGRDDDNQLPAKVAGTALEVVDFGDLAGYGTEALGIDDQPTPLLRILHYQCPQITRGDPKFIHGAAPGDICDISVGQVWEGQEVGVDMVVCGTKRRYQEWIPRADMARKLGINIIKHRSGNFRGFHELNDPILPPLLAKHDKFMALPWTNASGETVVLVETGELFVLFGPPPLTHTTAQRAMINFQSTSLGVWKMYNRRHESFRFPQSDNRMKSGPVCFWRWRLRSHPTVNPSDATQKYFMWDIELASKVTNPESLPLANQVAMQDPELFEMAVASMRQYRVGQVQEYRPDDDEQTGSGSSINPDDVPF